MGLRLMTVLLAALLAVPLAHAAKLYKWVDKDGNVTYNDRPPPDTAGYRVEEKYLGARTEAAGVRIPPDVLEKFPVVLYTAPKCSSCDSARAYLRNRGVPFTEKNVEGNRKLQDELIKQSGGLAVPTITVGSKVMQGYLESLLEGELNDAGYPKPGAEESAAPEQQAESAPEEEEAEPSENDETPAS